MATDILSEIRDNGIAPYCDLSERGLQAVFAGYFEVLHLKAGQALDARKAMKHHTSVIRGALSIEGEPLRKEPRVVDVAATAPGPLHFPAGSSGIRLRATEDTLLLVGKSGLIDDIVALDTLVKDRGETADMIELVLMRQSKAFRNLPPVALIDIYRRMTRETVAAGTEVFRQDERGDTFYFIRHGAAEVWREDLDDDEPRHVATLGTGDSFGEEGLILGGARTYTVRMVTDGELLSLDEGSFTARIARPTVSRISNQRALDYIGSGAQLVDVRYDDEWEEGHIPGAIHAPLDQLREITDRLELGRVAVVYCRSGKRSQAAALILTQEGFAAHSMDGGILDWPGEVVVPG